MTQASAPRRRIWIDLTNSPHVTFFRPILRRLDAIGVDWEVTARDFAQTVGLLERFGIRHTVIGRHGGAGLRRQGRWASRVARPRSCASGAGAASPRRSATDRTTSRSRRGSCASTARCCTTTRARPGMHRINFRLADKVMVPAVIPFEELRALGLRRAALPAVRRASRSRSRWPTSSRTTARRDELGLDRERPDRGAAPAGDDEPVPPRAREHALRRASSATCVDGRRPGRRCCRARTSRRPASRRRPGVRRPAAAGRRSVPRVGRRPRRQRRRHDEPRGGRAGRADLDDVRGPARRGGPACSSSEGRLRVLERPEDLVIVKRDPRRGSRPRPSRTP